MSAIGMASLGVHCGDPARGMASLGVICIDIVEIKRVGGTELEFDLSRFPIKDDHDLVDLINIITLSGVLDE